MTILVNGKEHQVEDAIPLMNFLQSKSLDLKKVAISLNQDILKRDQWRNIRLKEGDALEIAHFVGGG